MVMLSFAAKFRGRVPNLESISLLNFEVPDPEPTLLYKQTKTEQGLNLVLFLLVDLRRIELLTS